MDDTLELENIFSFHPATGNTGPLHDTVRGILLGAAEELVSLVPPTRERDQMLDRLREAMFWANAGIACNPPLGEDV